MHVTKREAQIKLDETDFDERRLINKRKKLINEGKNPDEIEKYIKRKRNEKKQKRFQRKNKFNAIINKDNVENNIDSNCSQQNVNAHMDDVNKSDY